jgi:hypothetical protein
MKSNVARLLDAMASSGKDDSRLDDVTLACLAFRETRRDGRTYLGAYGISPGGELVILAPARIARGTAADRVALFASLLLRGLRVRGTVLVDHAGCNALRSRIEAAWGARAMFLDGGPASTPQEEDDDEED